MKDADMKEWTIMFYFASDNPLASGIVSQLKAIKDAGFHRQANVIAYFDPFTKNTPSHVFDVNMVIKLKDDDGSRVGFTANDPFVRSLVLDKLWGDTDEDKKVKEKIKKYLSKTLVLGSRDGGHSHNSSGAEFPLRSAPKGLKGEPNPQQALTAFLDFCQDKYKARHYILCFLGHGQVVGNDIFLFDETADEPVANTVAGTPTARSTKQAGASSGLPLKPKQNSLTLRGLRVVLNEFNQRIKHHGGVLELVGFHSCSMSGLELAYEIQGEAKYIMASQGPAFVGSWPYRQILIRLFNDLNSSSFLSKDLEFEPLARRLKSDDNPICQYFMQNCFAETKGLLEAHEGSRRPKKELRRALVKELNRFLERDTEFHKSDLVNHIELSPETAQLKAENPQGAALMWLNRMLLQDAFPGEIKKNENRKRPTVKEMLIRMFYYCLHNSYDFQLAGYSFDITLCDLTKLKDEKKGIDVPLKNLASVLIDGLDNELVKSLILIAHLKAQSFFQEQYTDLYDFCFCLKERCEEVEEHFSVEENSKQLLIRVKDACDGIMEALRRGSEKRVVDGQEVPGDDGLIVRSEFIGPEFQYSHGMSIFFPWSRPVDNFFMKEYEEYKLNLPKDGTTWMSFLKKYFEETIRDLHRNEGDPREDFNQNRGDLERDVLELFQAMANSISRNDGQLGPPAKQGGIDPTGDGCTCPSIKNYPTFTRDSNYDVPLGPHYAEEPKGRSSGNQG